ncbi:MAG: hypothetical protein H6510_03075 [Acidobacteria bacterium]|nr:hypothetical protein [Acidobacteriota bacterium]MCB9396779.1 hypothetical protein [Acidobacteriota bacterium]
MKRDQTLLHGYEALTILITLVYFGFLDWQAKTDLNSLESANFGFSYFWPLLFLGLAYLLGQKYRLWVLAMFNLVATLITRSMAAGFAATQESPSFDIFGQLFDTKFGIAHTFHLSDWIWLLVSFWPLLFHFLRPKITQAQISTKIIIGYSISQIFLAALIALFALNTAMSLDGSRVSATEKWLDAPTAAAKASIFGVLSSQTFHYLSTPNTDADALTTTKALFNEILQDIHHANALESPSLGMAKDKNVVWIQIEGLQSCLVGASWNDIEITPNLNRLRGASYYWGHLVDIGEEGVANQANYALLHSRFPPSTQEGIVFSPPNLNDSALLNAMQAKSYKVLPFLSEPQGEEGIFAPLSPQYLPKSELFQKAFTTSAEQTGPYFTWIQWRNNNNSDLTVPDSVDRPFKDETGFLAEYLNWLHYMDAQLGPALDVFLKSDAGQDSVVMIFGDRSIGFPKNLNLTQADLDVGKALCGTVPWDTTQDFLPLWVNIPSKQAELLDIKARYGGSEIPIVGSLMDLTPTLFHLLDWQQPDQITGFHLFLKGLRVLPYPPIYTAMGEAATVFFTNEAIVFIDSQGTVVNPIWPNGPTEMDAEKQELCTNTANLYKGIGQAFRDGLMTQADENRP